MDIWNTIKALSLSYQYYANTTTALSACMLVNVTM